MITTSICVVITTTQTLMNGDVTVSVDNIDMQIKATPDLHKGHSWLRQYIAERCNAVLTARAAVAAERAALPAIATKAQFAAHVEAMKTWFGIDVSTWFDTPAAMQEFIETLKDVA